MDLAQAVSRTKAYGGFFRYPLSEEEIHHWLISDTLVSKKQISKYIQPLREKEIKIKNILKINTQKKENTAKEILKITRFIPFICLIALTGSVAANNSKKDDDLDLLIVTRANTLWLVRPLFLLLLSCCFPRRHPGDNPHKNSNAFCPNLWLDTTALSLPKNRRNLYTAHEVLQIKPLFDRGQTHLRFIKSNSWTKKYLSNAYQSLSQKKLSKTPESMISKFMFPLNAFMFVLQLIYMLPKKTSESVNINYAFFHKGNLSEELNRHLKNNSL